uniref:Uncharacterized protein n=1 Tax=Mus spicilegus TaxID=10103 RepID=A0A8C6GX99_MUSSI
MWKASAGHAVSITQDEGRADDWETDSDFVNDASEKEQRWCAKTVPLTIIRTQHSHLTQSWTSQHTQKARPRFESISHDDARGHLEGL